MDLVRTALERAGSGKVPVVGMLCFVEADWPLIGGSFTIDGHHVLRDATLPEQTIRDLHQLLAEALPPA